MRLHAKNDVEVALRAAVQSGVSAARHAHARTRLRAGRNAHVERLHLGHASLAAAVAAHGAKLAGPSAARAGDLKAHLSADLRHLSRAAAGRAGLLVAR